MIHQNGQLISIAFSEFNERPGSYVFESSNESPLPAEASLVGAVCVRFAFNKSCRSQIWPELTASTHQASNAAIDALIAEHQTVVTPLQAAPRVAGLADFEALSLHASSKRLNRDDRHILGGLAVFESTAGYTSGLFYNWLLDQEFKNQAKNIKIEYDDIRSHGAVSPELKAMAAELPVSDNQTFDNVVHHAIETVIALGLPDVRALRDELGTVATPLLFPKLVPAARAA
ncbi:MAG: hypothetical protein JWO35_521 [Candidatus Saccharibacteria bacterium]|nr:hypothetical protein [Candidatus Saccharibacteria bacterium]